MVVNFSYEIIKLSKASVLGVAEGTSSSILAAINYQEILVPSYSEKIRRGVSRVANDAFFNQYLEDKLGHLTQAERSDMEPVLV